jgi:parallel beta-helix repeat protein
MPCAVRRRSRHGSGRGLAIAAAAAAALLAAPAAAPARTFYLSPRGDDSAPGGSPRTAWRSFARAATVGLGPGDRLLLRRGGAWSGKLELSGGGTPSAPARVSAYGSGPRPRLARGRCLVVRASNVVIRGVEARGCDWAGIEVQGDGVTLTRNVVSNNVAGIFVRSSATGTRVLRNRVVNNDRMSVLTRGGGDDNGAFGVLVQGERTEIARNLITGSDAFSYDYGRDGAAVEVYGARGTNVHHNRAANNETFSELGNPSTAGTTYSYNVVRSSLPRSKFLVVPGADSGFGPARGTLAFRNTALLTGQGSEGVVCYSGCSADVLRIRANIVQARAKSAYADGRIDQGDNIFFGGKAQLELGPGSRFANPRFRNPRRGDLRLKRSSPARNRAGALQ